MLEWGLRSQLYNFIAGLFGMFATIFMTAGFTVAFVVPLMPYFRFFFSVLTWLVSTLEAVVAIPLVALAHLSPEGEGLPSQSAKAAYFLIFNIFVRPVLTLFGLIAGLLVFYVAIMLLNATFSIAVAGTNAMSHSDYGTLVRIAFTVTYAAAVYTCANNAFKTIGYFPEHALRWIGQQAHHERMGDGGRTIQAAIGQTQGLLGEKAINTIRLKS
jgi:conjugal transfer/type IV secretion protein DotA/TraY